MGQGEGGPTLLSRDDGIQEEEAFSMTATEAGLLDDLRRDDED